MGGGTYQQQQNGIEKYGYGSNENKIDALRERVFKEKAMEVLSDRLISIHIYLADIISSLWSRLKCLRSISAI
jgi:hypothetical protein